MVVGCLGTVAEALLLVARQIRCPFQRWQVGTKGRTYEASCTYPPCNSSWENVLFKKMYILHFD